MVSEIQKMQNFAPCRGGPKNQVDMFDIFFGLNWPQVHIEHRKWCLKKYFFYCTGRFSNNHYPMNESLFYCQFTEIPFSIDSKLIQLTSNGIRLIGLGMNSVQGFLYGSFEYSKFGTRIFGTSCIWNMTSSAQILPGKDVSSYRHVRSNRFSVQACCAKDNFVKKQFWYDVFLAHSFW